MAGTLWILVALCVFAETVECKKRKKYDDLTAPPEARLYNYLTERYDSWNPDRAIIPVYNTSETQNVQFGLALIAMLDFDEDTNVAKFSTWERYLWNDRFLRWKPEDHDKISQIRLPSDKIWKPDIVLYNGFDPDTKLQDALTVVTSDGTVLYIPRVYRKILCDTNSTTISCRLKFGSWTYDGFRVNLDFYDGLEKADLRDYISNKNYELVDNYARKNVKYYPCCAEPYIDLSFTVDFKKSSWWGKK